MCLWGCGYASPSHRGLLGPQQSSSVCTWLPIRRPGTGEARRPTCPRAHQTQLAWLGSGECTVCASEAGACAAPGSPSSPHASLGPFLPRGPQPMEPFCSFYTRTEGSVSVEAVCQPGWDRGAQRTALLYCRPFSRQTQREGL